MPTFVAWLVAGISRIFATRLGAWVAQAMVFLGLAWTTHTLSMAGINALISSQMHALDGQAVQWLVFFNMPAYVSIIVSAYGAGAVKRAFLVKRTTVVGS